MLTFENYHKKNPIKNNKKIAFCFLIYDKINLEELWHIFFNNIDKDLYNIYIHYKINSPLKYFEKNKLNNCIPTKWGDISLVNAQNLLLKEAIKDEENEHFIFLSNSCIPLKNFDFIYTNLNTNYSYFDISPNKNCFPRCNKLKPYINLKKIQKSAQWCILNKKHVNIILNNRHIYNLFKKHNIFAPDEHIYICTLFHENFEMEIVNISTTFKNFKKNSDSHPEEFKSLNKKTFINIVNSKNLFARKFTTNCLDSILKNFENFYKE